MCGIAGAFALGRQSRIGDADLRQVGEMTERLRHRGPDQQGIHREDRCALGNSRLKIIDLSDQADLPMSNEDGSVWLAYNGEVTNFRELRRRYRLDDGHVFRSTSDTEVLIHLYEELGIEFLQQLSGMFALCLLDRNRGRAWVVRDFYGLRPLFYMAKPDRLYFASEIKAFLDLPRFRGGLNHEGLYHYFSLAYIPDRMTPFEEIVEVRGGELLEVDLRAGEFERRRYHTVSYEPDPDLRERDLVPVLRERMRDAVERNLISDAPLGLTLSGGFDTSSIACLARDIDPEREIHTFSIKMEEASFDESPFQRRVVEWIDAIHHEISVSASEVLEHFVEHMAFMDEPSGDGAAIPSYLLSRAAKPYVSVLLSGEGGDEVFNAYETHLAFKVRRLYRRFTPYPLRWLVRSAVNRLPCDYSKLSFDFVAKRFAEGAELGAPEAHLYWRHVLTEADKRELMPRHAGCRPSTSIFREMWDRLDYPDGLNRISHIDLEYFFIDDLMVKNDRTFMAHSVEARFPWVDRELVEFVHRIPPGLRLKGFTRRYLQKQAMRPLVPPEIFRRSNMGLEMPHSLWLLDELNPLVRQYLTRERVERSGFLDYPTVNRLWEEHRGRKRDHGRALWCILTLLVWLELFVEEKSYTRYLHR